MNDLKSYLSQGLCWLVASYSEEPVVTLELSVLAGHIHFLYDDREPIMPVYKIVERIKQACEELQTVGFIGRYEFTGKKQGLLSRYLTVTPPPSIFKQSDSCSAGTERAGPIGYFRHFQ
jgi:REP element-mobilizing transposase RayT